MLPPGLINFYYPKSVFFQFNFQWQVGQNYLAIKYANVIFQHLLMKSEEKKN